LAQPPRFGYTRVMFRWITIALLSGLCFAPKAEARDGSLPANRSERLHQAWIARSKRRQGRATQTRRKRRGTRPGRRLKRRQTGQPVLAGHRRRSSRSHASRSPRSRRRTTRRAQSHGARRPSGARRHRDHATAGTFAMIDEPLPPAWSPVLPSTVLPEPVIPMPPTKPGRSRLRHQVDDQVCLRRLRRYHVPFRRAKPHYGIRTPIRILGRVHGIRYRNKWKPSEKPLMDCLLALTLYRAAPIYRRHGIKVVVYSNTYRRPSRGDPRPSRHGLGLAMDVHDLVFGDGVVLNVEKDWQKFYGRPGRCVGSVGTKARRMRSLICDLEAANVYRRILTPDADHGHRNHFHMSAGKAHEEWRRDRWAGRHLYQPLPGTKLFGSWEHWYMCYKHVSWRSRKACYRRRRPSWVAEGNPYAFRPRHMPRYLRGLVRYRPHHRKRRHRPRHNSRASRTRQAARPSRNAQQHEAIQPRGATKPRRSARRRPSPRARPTPCSDSSPESASTPPIESR